MRGVAQENQSSADFNKQWEQLTGRSGKWRECGRLERAGLGLSWEGGEE